MEKERKLSRGAKAAIIAGAVVVFLGILVLGAEIWAKNKIRSAIEKQAIEIAGTKVDVGVGRIGVNIPSMSVSVRNITMKSQNTDTSRRDVGLVSLDAAVEKITLRGVRYKKVEGKPAISAKSLVVDTPHGTIVTKAAENKDAVDGKEQKPFPESITEQLSSVTVGKIEIRNAGLDYVAWTGEDNTRVGLKKGEFIADGFRLDTLPATDRVLFSDAVKLTAGQISYGYGAGSMVLQADTLSLDSSGKLSLGAFRLIPQFPKNNFAQQSKGHQDWTKLDIIDLDFTGVNFAKLLNENTLMVDSVSLGRVEVASYKNRQVYQEPRVKKMIWETVQQLPIAVDIRRIDFDNVTAEYDELSETGDSPGVIRFTHGKGVFANVTNIAEGHEPYFTLDASAMLMGNGLLEASFRFPVSPSTDHFDVKGQLGKTDFTALNPTFTPLMNVSIDSGMVNSIHFNLSGTNTKSHVNLTMLYNDLSVTFLKKHDHTKERKFLTFIADDLIIKSDNPGRNGKVRPGEGEFERDPHRSMFNYLWKSLAAGIMDTVK